MKKFKSVDELISQLQPDKPVYCIRKNSIQIASKFFQERFPGKILYAVKTNPNKEVLKTTKVLIYGFIAKMIIFGVFLFIIIHFYSFNALAFVFSFLTSFLVFHTLETIFLKLLFDRKRI